MLRYWGRPYFKSNFPKQNTNETDVDLAFPFNTTEYITSGKKAEYDSIWMKALNLSNSEQNKSHSPNEFMMKSRMLADMVDAPVHPHSFATVMAIASLFLFFTLGITVTLVIFCRKRNIVFALQKSEQEDEIDYEMDDMEMDTNTDIEYASDDETMHRDQCYADSHTTNTDSPCRKPLMAVNSNQDIKLTGITPIYRPKRASQYADSKGAYHAVQVCTRSDTGDEESDTLSNTSVTGSPTAKRHPRFNNTLTHSRCNKNTAALFLAHSAIKSAQNTQVALKKISHSDQSISIEIEGKGSQTTNGLKHENSHHSPAKDSGKADYLKEMKEDRTVGFNARSVSCDISGSHNEVANSANSGNYLPENTYDPVQNMRYLAHEEAIVHSLTKRDSRNVIPAKCACKALFNKGAKAAQSNRQNTNQTQAQRGILRNNNVNFTAPYNFSPNNPFLNDIYVSPKDELSTLNFSASNQNSEPLTKSSTCEEQFVLSNSVCVTRTHGVIPHERVSRSNSCGANLVPHCREHWVTFDQK